MHQQHNIQGCDNYTIYLSIYIYGTTIQPDMYFAYKLLCVHLHIICMCCRLLCILCIYRQSFPYEIYRFSLSLFSMQIYWILNVPALCIKYTPPLSLYAHVCNRCIIILLCMQKHRNLYVNFGLENEIMPTVLLYPYKIAHKICET